MDPKEYLEILKTTGKLKTTYRHCYTEEGRKESVADHTCRMAQMAMLMSGVEEFAGADLGRVIRMCLIHDLGEAFTGDIPTFDKTASDEAREDSLFDQWVASFPEPVRGEWQALLKEMGELQTMEARLYKALDKLEAVISHNESDLSTWLPLEYDLQLTYTKQNVAFSDFLSCLDQEVDDWTRRKIREES